MADAASTRVSTRATIVLALIVLAIAAGCYWNTLGLGFTWDDDWLILENDRIDDPTYIRYMLFERDRLWRPLKRMSFMLDYWLWGPKAVDNPQGIVEGLRGAAGFHLTNLLIQAAACLALFALVARLGVDRRFAAVAAILFAVHPIHVEAVANISHRKEPMSLLFYLLAFLAYLEARSPRLAWPVAHGTLWVLVGLWARAIAVGFERDVGALCWLVVLVGLAEIGRGLKHSFSRRVTASTPGTWLWLGCAFVFFLNGMLSKEVGVIMFPATVVLYEVLLVPGGWQQAWKRLSKLAIPVGIVLVLFTAKGYLGRLPRYMGAEQIDWITAGKTDQYGPVFWTAVKSIGESAKLLVWPHPLYLDRDMPLARSPAEPGVLLGLLVIAALVTGAWWGLRRAPLVTFALAWFGLNMLPVTNFIPLTHWLFAERFVYVPSVGFSLLVALGLQALWQGRLPRLNHDLQRTVAVGLLASQVILLGGMTVLQNRIWNNSTTLWQQTLTYNPQSYRALHGYGLELYNAGRSDEAEDYYRRSIAAFPSYPEPRYALALLLLEKKDYEGAIEHAEVDARLDRDNPEPYIVIGNAYFNQAMGGPPDGFAPASRAYRKAVERKPTHNNGLYNMANVCHAMGRRDEAISYIDEAVRLRPTYESYLLRGNILEYVGRFAEAVDSYRQALAIEPDHSSPYSGIARALIREKRYAEALQALDQAYAQDPSQTHFERTREQLLRMIERGQ